MSLLLETICIENHTILNLAGHLSRMRLSLAALEMPFPSFINEAWIYEFYNAWRERTFHSLSGCYKARIKCRLLYSATTANLSFEPYARPEIIALQIVHSEIQYKYKFADRKMLESLRPSSSVDALIVKSGLLTDTTFCNVALFAIDSWYTPESPLLAGTKRACLLAQGQIFKRRIEVADLAQFSKIRLFNSMIEPGELELPISVITGRSH